MLNCIINFPFKLLERNAVKETNLWLTNHKIQNKQYCRAYKQKISLKTPLRCGEIVEPQISLEEDLAWSRYKGHWSTVCNI